MVVWPSQSTFLLLWILCTIIHNPGIWSLKVQCNEKDQQKLLNFKQEIIDSTGLLSTWSTKQDCCQWEGVRCDNVSHRVTQLSLPSRPKSLDKRDCLEGEFSLSNLLELESLTYLDLSGNNFLFTPPHCCRNYSSKLFHLELSYNHRELEIDDLTWLTHLASLEYLDLSGIDLHATLWLQSVTKLPSLSELYLSECKLHDINSTLEFANFTSLQVLVLSGNYFQFDKLPNWLFSMSNDFVRLDLSNNHQELEIHDLTWLTLLPSLRYLDFSDMNLHTSLWLQSVTMLPSLSKLRLSNCQLHDLYPTLEFANFTSLKALDLSNNHFQSIMLPNWLFNMSGCFEYLDLSYNNFQGSLPQTLLNLRNLKYLNLGQNNLSGCIPNWFGQYENLLVLSLPYNSFLGPIPKTLGNLSSLTMLILADNPLNGSLPEDIGQLSNLEVLRVHDTALTGVISEKNFAKLSNLMELYLASPALTFHFDPHWVPPFQLEWITLGYVQPELPAWLYTQKSLKFLQICCSRFSFDAQHKFLKLMTKVEVLEISECSINGDLSKVLLNSRLAFLSQNNLRGLPQLSPNVTLLWLRNNSLSGTLSPLLCQKMEGRSNLMFLDISHNRLSGGLTDCWMNWKSLVHVKLTNNRFTGHIPQSMSLLSDLQSLQLDKNNLSGHVTPSLQNLLKLRILNLGENKFSGNISFWIGQNVKVLLLRSNQFSGNIPTQICQLTSLIVLDIADNQLSGQIPNCLHNITSLLSLNISTDYFDFRVDVLNKKYDFTALLELHIKGRQLSYESSQELIRSVDLSQNNLIGTIPLGMLTLTALQSLNLSQNQLMGRIPNEIGNMKGLEVLDLSCNRLEGEIPQTMSGLSFLSFLNLSVNNFTGQIPPTSQLQSFDALSYTGNPELCGAPLTRNCSKSEKTNSTRSVEGNEDEDEFLSWFYIGMGVGFAIGFWIVCASLFCNRTWRHAYFRFLYDLKNQLCIFIILKMNIFR